MRLQPRPKAETVQRLSGVFAPNDRQIAETVSHNRSLETYFRFHFRYHGDFSPGGRGISATFNPICLKLPSEAV